VHRMGRGKGRGWGRGDRWVSVHHFRLQLPKFQRSLGAKETARRWQSKSWPRVHNDVAPFRRSLDQRSAEWEMRWRWSQSRIGSCWARSKEAATTRKIVNKPVKAKEGKAMRGVTFTTDRKDHDVWDPNGRVEERTLGAY